MKTLNLIFFVLLIYLLLTSCNKEGNTILSACDDTVIICADEYLNAPDDQLNIISVEINEDCLEIEFGSSGCDGSTWDLKLIDADVIIESYPLQRNVRLSLKNDEVCDAYFTKKISFDIRQLQIGGNILHLNIKGWEEQVLYEY